MPGRNKTGPFGQGPMTGRGLGDCTGNRGNYGRGFGGGFGFCHGYGNGYGRGHGRGLGFRHGYGNPYSAEDEKHWLTDKIRYLKDQLVFFEKQLSEMENDDDQKIKQ